MQLPPFNTFFAHYKPEDNIILLTLLALILLLEKLIQICTTNDSYIIKQKPDFLSATVYQSVSFKDRLCIQNSFQVFTEKSHCSQQEMDCKIIQIFSTTHNHIVKEPA